MENLKNSMMEYWLVKVGNLYYAGGLDRNLPEDEEANKLLIMHEKYIVSSDIEKGTLESIKEVYKSRKEDLDKAYISQCE